MIAIPLIFLSGLLGSVHCLGMCGGLAIAVGANATTMRQNLGRQMSFSLGRIVSYTFGGAAAGFLGQRLESQWTWLIEAQAVLAIVAGMLLLVEGLRALGFSWRSPRGASACLPCLAAGGLRSLLASTSWGSALAGGVLTAFMPCGLVYAYIAIAASTASMIGGAATMAAFGLGTVPLMLAAGLGFQRLSLRWRPLAFRVAGTAVIVVGLVSLARGGSAILKRGDDATLSEAAEACPLCATGDGPAVARHE